MSRATGADLRGELLVGFQDLAEAIGVPCARGRKSGYEVGTLVIDENAKAALTQDGTSHAVQFSDCQMCRCGKGAVSARPSIHAHDNIANAEHHATPVLVDGRVGR